MGALLSALSTPLGVGTPSRPPNGTELPRAPAVVIEMREQTRTCVSIPTTRTHLATHTHTLVAHPSSDP